MLLALAGLLGMLIVTALDSPLVGAQAPSDEATLSALIVNDGTIDVDLNPGFTSAGTSYRTAVTYRGALPTVTATPTDAGATVAFQDRTGARMEDADPGLTGYQVSLTVGASEFRIVVTAQDGMTTKLYELTVERDSARILDWTPTRDLNDVVVAGNASPQGIWSDGTTMWVADDDDDKIYAYVLATGDRDASKEFSLHADNASPGGMWSNGTTVWLADTDDAKLYAYALTDDPDTIGTDEKGQRDASKDISLHADNSDPWGIWSDETTIWVTDSSDEELYAYDLDTGTRQDGTGSTTNKEFGLHSDSDVARGIWSDGSTLWVSSSNFGLTKRLVAYTLDVSSDGTVGSFHGVPDWDKSFFPPAALAIMGAGIWSDGNTAIWVVSTGADGKIYSFNTPPSEAGGLSLSSLTVNDGTSDVSLHRAFDPDEAYFWTSVTNDVNVVTVAAVAGNTAATVGYGNADADPVSPGHQARVEVGTTRIDIEVAAADGRALIHSVYVERDSARFGAWTPTRDIHGLGTDGVTETFGAWSDGTTMWVLEREQEKLYAYALTTGVRDQSKEFDTHSDNGSPRYLWSDGDTIWVGGSGSAPLLYAYRLKDDPDTTDSDEKGQRDASKDITLASPNDRVDGIWSNGTDTVWVVDSGDTMLYAYTLDIASDGTAGVNHGGRQADKDIALIEGRSLVDIWSDGTTVWVGNNGDDSIRAYTLATGEREEDRDIPFALNHRGVTRGIWSDGTTMWTAHRNSVRLPIVYDRLFSHRLPVSEEGATTVSNLTVTPSPAVPDFTAILRPGFSFTTSLYRVAVPHSAAHVTISPTRSDSAATVAYQDAGGTRLEDADSSTTGHQVSVPVGRTAIDVKVTKAGEASLIYTVVVERDGGFRYNWTPSRDLNSFYDDNPEVGGDSVRAVWGHEKTTLYVAPINRPIIFAFNRSDGTRDRDNDIEVLTDIRDAEPILFAGIWSDGTTMWVVDYLTHHDEDGMDTKPTKQEPAHGKVFAYRLLDGVRDKSKEFALDTIHNRSVRGVWSNGATLWVSDYALLKLIAYHLKDDPDTMDEDEFGKRDASKDISLHSDNDAAQGIWSDGTTIWVADFSDRKFYAYVLTTGTRAEGKEFDLYADNKYPRGAWSDGATMWVPDQVGRKLYSYDMMGPVEVTAAFESSTHTVAEGGTADVKVTLSKDPERTVVIPITATNQHGAVDGDYSGVPTILTFDSGETEQSLTFAAVDDTVDDDGESVKLTFGSPFPIGVSAGTTHETIVSITDDDGPAVEVSFEYSTYTVSEGSGVTVKVKLSAEPERPVIITLSPVNQGETSSADYSGVPTSLTFNSGDTEKSFTFTATQDSVDDDGESVKLTFGSPLPTGVSAGTTHETTVSITDDDAPSSLTVNFKKGDYSVTEGSSEEIVLTLDDDPERTVTIPLSWSNEDGASDSDHNGVPTDVTFNAGETSKSFDFSAVSDRIGDPGEKVRISLGAPPSGVTQGTTSETVVTIEDVTPSGSTTVSFSADAYEVLEGSSTTITVVMSDAPGSDAIIPIEFENEDGASSADYSLSATSLTFGPTDTEKSFTFTAADDAEDDDGESVKLTFGSPLPTGVSAGTTHETTVSITDDDVPDDGSDSCDSPVWTASLRLGDQTTADWGRFKLVHQLFHPGPPSSLSADEFEYQDENFVIMSINLVPMVPTGTAARSGPFATPEYASFSIDIDRGEWVGPVSDGQWSGPLRGILKRHFQDWTLYIDDMAFPFADALFTAEIEWQGAEFNDMFNSWSPATEYQLCIDDTPVSAPTSATPPSAPGYLRLFPVNGTLFASWREPFSNGGSEITRYEVQVKEWGDSWTNASDVREFSSPPNSNGHQVRFDIDDLTNGVDYAVRVRAVNAVGESPYSGETWVTQQADTPWLEDAVVDGALLSLEFDRQLDGTSVPAPEDFRVLVHEESLVPDSVLVTGRKVILTLPEPVVHSDAVDFIYILPEDPDVPRIRDRDGNYYTTLYLGYDQARNETAVVSLPPVTVSVVDRPEAHNGADSFTFQIAFSESVKVLFSYGSGMVDVSGGTVTSVQNLNRRTEEWEFTVAPDPNADVEINVPANRPCEDNVYHPCGNGNRPLSNSLELTVPFLQTQSQSGNSPATGAPVITGTPRVGETLTADASNIEDADGLDNVSYSYQWISNDWVSDTDIAGETGPSYTMTSGDEGKAIKVRVTFTDDAGNEESLTSAAVAASVSRSDRTPAAPGTPTVSPEGTGALTVSWKMAPDDGGPPITGYLVQWKEAADRWETAADVSEATVTGTTHTITGLTDGVEYAIRVVANSEAGSSPASEEAFGTPRETTPPELSAAIADGTMLTLIYNEALDENTVPGVDTFTVMAGSDERGIARVSVVGAAVILILDSAVVAEDAVTVSYAVPTDESALRIRDEAGNHAASFDNQAVTNNTATGQPTIGGTARMGETLTADASNIEDADGLDNVSYSYQWVANDGTTDTDISGETDAVYTLVADDVGKTIKVKVTFTDDAGNEATLTSVATDEVGFAVQQQGASNTPATGEPTISGTVQVGETLTADTTGITDADGLDNVSYTYQWVRNDGNSDTDILDATDSGYMLVADDLGKTIKVRVTFTDDAGNETTLTSAATDEVAPVPPPLTVSLRGAAPATHDGSAEFTFEIEFSEEFPLSFKKLKLHTFDVTDGEVLKAQRVVKSSNISWRMTVRPDSNADVTVLLPVTTRCGAQGSICTQDGRKLSNSLNFTVTGPNQ